MMTSVIEAPPQHLVALGAANKARLNKAGFLGEIKRAERSAISVLEALPGIASSITVSELLEAQPTWGPVKTGKVLRSLGIPGWLSLVRMTERQRCVLIEKLRDMPISKASTRSIKQASQGDAFQRHLALQQANRIRMQRAELKRELKARKVDIINVLANPPSFLSTAKVYDLLLAVPKLGRVKARAVMLRAKVSPTKTFGSLVDAQRKRLIAQLT